jgi:hypothetical protein
VRTGDNADSREDEVVWTFEPDIVYSALEYLMARVGAEHPDHASDIRNCRAHFDAEGHVDCN